MGWSFRGAAAIVARRERHLPRYRHPRRPPAGRRPLRLRAVQGPPRGGRGAGGDRHRRSSARRTARRTVQFVVAARCATGWPSCSALPDGYEVILGNGGTTAFWDAAIFGLIEERSQHLQLRRVLVQVRRRRGRGAAPRRPDRHQVRPGRRTPSRSAEAGVDAYCLTHNETSTGVCMPIGPTGRRGPRAGRRHVGRRRPARRPDRDRRLLLRPPEGPGLRRRAVDRRRAPRPPSSASSSWRRRTAGSRRSLDLKIALDNSRKDQTYNTPALATIFLANDQAEWIAPQRRASSSPPAAATGRPPSSTAGPRQRDFATPFVTDADSARRSSAPSTSTTRSTPPPSPPSCGPTASSTPTRYRKLGRNQLRIAMFPAIDPADVEALTACIDHVVAHL